MLTTAQLQALKADIIAASDAPCVALKASPANGDLAFAVADLYNLTASPDFIVWRTSVPIEEMMANGFVWNEVDALTAGQARIWQWMAQLGVINPSKLAVRQGLSNAFSANAPTTLGTVATGVGGIQPHLRRKATRLEKVLIASGTGTTASPAVLGFEGTVVYQEVLAAMAS